MRIVHYSPAESLTLARIMLIKADQAEAEGLIRGLEEEPYEVLLTSSVSEALAVLTHQSVDVVLADHGLLDVLDGTLFAYLRAQHPRVIRILLASEADSGFAVRALRTGDVHHHVRIPGEQPDLALVLYNALVQRSFLPPESQGVLPLQSPDSSIMPARLPGNGR